MTQIPILNGIFVSSAPEFRTSYPVNFYAVPKDTGISQGFLQPASGIVEFTTGPGLLRGGIEWNGLYYAVMGSKLVFVSPLGTVTELGDVENDGDTVTMDYDFSRLAIRSNGKLFYWDGATLTEVTDPDLGVVNDLLWVDGYFMTTDGEFLVVTELNDPTMVDPLKYGSAEADPDPILAIKKIRNEIYAANRETIEVFDNVGGELFPFARIEGAQIEKGTLGRDCICVFLESLAFIGSGRNEQPAVYVAMNGRAEKISTHEIDQILEEYTEGTLAASVVEARNEGSHEFLYIHLPDKCLLYDAGASRDLQTPVWTVLQSGLEETGEYRGKFFTRVYNKWFCGDPQEARIGCLVNTISSHWNEPVRWEFGTRVVYGEGRGAIFHEMELVGLSGYVAFGEDPYISTSYSLDGISWSQDKTIKAGQLGDRLRRLVWYGLGYMRNWRIQRFRGTSHAHMCFARLEARIEPMAF
jgi:hypothetical protein